MFGKLIPHSECVNFTTSHKSSAFYSGVVVCFHRWSQHNITQLSHFLSSFPYIFLSFPYIPHRHTAATTTSLSLSFLMRIFETNPVSNCNVTHHLPPSPLPALWSGPIRIQTEGLIMQAAVSPLRWGPPGDSSTASDWGCATEADSSRNNTEKRMLMDQIRWELRGRERGGEEEGAGRHSWSAVIQTRPRVRDSVYLLCMYDWEALAAQDYAPSYWHVFPPKCLEVWEMKEGCEQREGGAGKGDR